MQITPGQNGSMGIEIYFRLVQLAAIGAVAMNRPLSLPSLGTSETTRQFRKKPQAKQERIASPQRSLQ
jgi:hypothetical protein